MKSPPDLQPRSVGSAADARASADVSKPAAQSTAHDPIRLLVADEHVFARRLLESAGNDAIPEAPLRRLAQALSVPVPAPPMPSVGHAFRAGRWAAIRGYAASVVGLGAIGVLASQWPAGAEPAAASVVEAAALPVAASASDRDALASSGIVSTTAAEAVTVATDAAPAVAELASGSKAEPRSKEPQRSPRGPARRAAEAPSATSTLTEELRALELAQRALRANHVDDAERALAAHSRRFSRPMLAVEAELLEIDVLLARGLRSKAVERARALVSRPGAGRYRERLGPLLHAETEGPR